MLGDRVYTTRSGVRIGSAYTPPNRTQPCAVERPLQNITRNPDAIVTIACTIAALALAAILAVWG